MSARRQIVSLVLPLSAVVALAATPADGVAQGRTLFQWSGRVDREVRISMRGRDTWTSATSSDRARSRADVESALPRRDGQVRVRVESGRGDVDVVQQPNARNDYTTVVRIQDRSGGADRYRLNAYWAPSGSSENDRGGWGWGRADDDRDRRRNDEWDRRGDGRRADRDDDDRDDDRYGGSSRGRGAVRILRWSGAVDGELEIRLRDEQVTYRTVNGAGPRDVRADLPRRGLPQQNTQIYLANTQGRGEVTLVQRPEARNGYTTVVRIRDPQGGYGFYDFDLTWR